jgi:hypothetical protein
MTFNKPTLFCGVLLFAACIHDPDLAEHDQDVTHGGVPQTAPGGKTAEPTDVDQFPWFSYRADCDGDGIDDCTITEIRFGPLAPFSTTITYTNPQTQVTTTETICNGDYDGDDPGDASDDEPCNAPLCSDDNGPHPPPDVNFPPDDDGPCAAYVDAVGEVCVNPGNFGQTCDCIFTDPVTGEPDWPGGGYPDDTDGDGTNDCPP